MTMQQPSIYQRIDEMKEKLNESVIQNGLNSHITVHISQELDALLNLAERIRVARGTGPSVPFPKR
ncbi:Spo0E family sporulation regulatory protein-aspartic acid phosphatase [Rossellomorea sp. GCM10028870]|uniref:Spo0E family sporulation regulatory protein-aspartic acid phosphatase n=1 Tax=Rossellomorea sp. GCM10028870 TaxID=3273426 RepID=UPI0036119B5A